MCLGLAAVCHSATEWRPTSVTVSGVVRYNGNPVADAEVLLIIPYTGEDDHSERKRQTLGRALRTDSQGHFEWAIESPSWISYSIHVLKGEIGNFKADTGQLWTRDGVVHRLCTVNLYPIVTVRGTVTCTTSSIVPRARVITFGAIANNYPTFEVQPVSLSPDGSFVLHIDGSEPRNRYGCSFVAITVDGYGGIGPMFREAIDKLNGSSATLTGIKIELKKLVNGSFRLFDQNDKPLVGENVIFYPPLGLGGRKWNWGPFGGGGETDKDGIFTFRNVWPGLHEVLISGDLYMGATVFDLSNPSTNTAIVRKVITVGHERYYGTVKNAQGQPLADVAVGACVYTADQMWTNTKWTKTDAEGKYSITGLAKRPWGLRFLKPGCRQKDLHDQVSDSVGLAPGEQTVVLEEGPFTEGNPPTEGGTLNSFWQSEYDQVMKALAEGKQRIRDWR